MTLGEALHSGTRALEANHIPAPRLTAEVLLASACGVGRPYLYAHSEDLLGPEAALRYRSMLDRRASGEPLQYITGVQEFYGRAFAVNPSVLIPRPETEHVVEAALEIHAAHDWTRARVLDVGTGSGCIAITLALELPGAAVWASDLSLEALHTARENARRLEAPVLFACVESLASWSGPFELIASNPPYVEAVERPGLQREVRDHEPETALFGHGDPLELYGRILEESALALVGGGYLLLEIGYSMEAAVQALFGTGWTLLPTRKDLQGIPRVVVARKR